jgi:uncharacterized membrane protein YgcG
MTLAAALIACGQAPAGETVQEADVTAPATIVPRGVKVDMRGSVIDPANALSEADKQAIKARLDALKAATGRVLVVIAATPTKGDNLERIGFAISSSAGKDGPLLMIVDPKSGRVRMEGDMTADRRAMVAAAAGGPISAGNLKAGIIAGVDQAGHLLK